MVHVYVQTTLSCPYIHIPKKFMPFSLQLTNLDAQSPSNNPPKVTTKFTNMVVKLLEPPPSITLCKFKGVGILYQFSTA